MIKKGGENMGRKSITDKIEDLKQELEALELRAEDKGSSKNGAFEVGESYFIRTVTYHLTGKVKNIKGQFLVLKDAAWIADSGRFHGVINNGSFGTNAEIEPLEVDVLVNMNSITDAFIWKHKLPRQVK